MELNNNEEIKLSEEARSQVDSFWRSKKGAISDWNTSVYLTRIHRLVVTLGVLVVLLSLVLAYVIANPQLLVKSAGLEQPVKVTQNEDKSSVPLLSKLATEILPEEITVLVASIDLAEGTLVRKDHFKSVKVNRDEVPDSAIEYRNLDSIIGKYTRVIIPAGLTASSSDFLDEQPSASSSFDIPKGYRAVTIPIDARTGVEGFAKPGTRVDILWFYRDKSKRERVATIIRLAKVLSVGGITDKDAPSLNLARSWVPATLLVTKKQAHVIELARNLGSLSLSLAGVDEAGDHQEEEEPLQMVTVDDVLTQLQEARGEGKVYEGVMTATDPQTGKTRKYVLSKRQWQEEVAPNKNTN